MGKHHDHEHREHGHQYEHAPDHEDLHEAMHGGRSMRGGPWARPGGRGRFSGERGGWGGGRRMRRGDIRRAILIALSAEPAHGYEVMRRLEEMSRGMWQPSPGSVYPHLQMLEDEGMVRAEEKDGTRVFRLTDAGRAEAQADPRLPWESAGEGEDKIRQLKHSMGELFLAAKQLSGAGEVSHIDRGIAVIQKARKEIYRILAED